MLNPINNNLYTRQINNLEIENNTQGSKAQAKYNLFKDAGIIIDKKPLSGNIDVANPEKPILLLEPTPFSGNVMVVPEKPTKPKFPPPSSGTIYVISPEKPSKPTFPPRSSGDIMVMNPEKPVKPIPHRSIQDLLAVYPERLPLKYIT